MKGLLLRWIGHHVTVATLPCLAPTGWMLPTCPAPVRATDCRAMGTWVPIFPAPRFPCGRPTLGTSLNTLALTPSSSM